MVEDLQNLMAQIGWFILLQIRALPCNYVTSIAIDGSGNKWIGTVYWYGGLAKFDGTNWTDYTTSNSGLPNKLCLFNSDRRFRE